MAQEKQSAATNIAVVLTTGLSKRVHWKGSAQELWVQNLDSVNDAQISFDGGVEWWTITAGRLDIYTLDTDEVHFKRVGANNVSLELLVFLKD